MRLVGCLPVGGVEVLHGGGVGILLLLGFCLCSLLGSLSIIVVFEGGQFLLQLNRLRVCVMGLPFTSYKRKILELTDIVAS